MSNLRNPAFTRAAPRERSGACRPREAADLGSGCRFGGATAHLHFPGRRPRRRNTVTVPAAPPENCADRHQLCVCRRLQRSSGERSGPVEMGVRHREWNGGTRARSLHARHEQLPGRTRAPGDPRDQEHRDLRRPDHHRLPQRPAQDHGKFSNYDGTLEARIKLDIQPGLWPAWWAMGASFAPSAGPPAARSTCWRTMASQRPRRRSTLRTTRATDVLTRHAAVLRG